MVPIVFYWQDALNHDAMTASQEQLPQEFSSPIRSAEHAAARLSTILIYWHPAVLVPCLFSIVPPFNLPIAVVDTVLAAYVAMIIHQQEAYVPFESRFCRDMDGWDGTWKADHGYFAYAAQRAGWEKDAGYLCSTFVREWQYEVAIVYVQAAL